jgi:hypothetical protein
MTYTVLGLLVGSGIDQQPHTVGVTIQSGTNQRRPSVLRVEFAENRALPTQLQTQQVSILKE